MLSTAGNNILSCGHLGATHWARRQPMKLLQGGGQCPWHPVSERRIIRDKFKETVGRGCRGQKTEGLESFSLNCVKKEPFILPTMSLVSNILQLCSVCGLSALRVGITISFDSYYKKSEKRIDF